jgi:hypothetical protein
VAPEVVPSSLNVMHVPLDCGSGLRGYFVYVRHIGTARDVRPVSVLLVYGIHCCRITRFGLTAIIRFQQKPCTSMLYVVSTVVWGTTGRGTAHESIPCHLLLRISCTCVILIGIGSARNMPVIPLPLVCVMPLLLTPLISTAPLSLISF